MKPEGFNVDDVGKARNLGRGGLRSGVAEPKLTVGVIAPRPHRAVRLECDAVDSARSDGADAVDRNSGGRCGRCVGAITELTVGVVAPCEHRAVRSQSNRVLAASSDHRDVAGSAYLAWVVLVGGVAESELTKAVASPCPHNTITNSEGVIVTSSNGGHVVQGNGHRGCPLGPRTVADLA